MSGTTGEPQALETAESAPPTDSATAENAYQPGGKGIWSTALILSAVFAVFAINYSPKFFELAPEFENVDPMAPSDQQDSAAQSVAQAASQAYLQKEWKNSLSAYAFAGICLALPSIVAFRRYRIGGAIGALVASIIFGGLCGLVAVSLGTIVGQQMGAAGYDVDSIAPDILAWSVMGVVLSLPAALALVIGGEKPLSQSVISTPLAGVLAGVVVTIGVSLFLPSANTSKIPPFGLTLTAIWFATLVGLILVLSTFTGARKPKAESAV